MKASPLLAHLKNAIFITGCFLASGCSQSEDPIPAPLAETNPKLSVLDCGWLGFADITLFGLSNEESAVREMFVPCYLIEHQGKHMVWDFGLPPNIVGTGVVEYVPGATMRYDVSIIDQLKTLGLEPSDIDFVAPSHLHFDHAGALSLFKGSTLLIQKAERDSVVGEATGNVAIDPSLFAGMEDTPTVQLEGDHDVFGDGKVVIYSTPGHTAGHQVLFIDLENTGKIVLSGDLYHFRFSRENQRTPEFNFSRDQTLESMERVEALLAETGATLWIEHDHALADTLKKSPAFYD
jgi:N-acyl homoserine lactone hydrolase